MQLVAKRKKAVRKLPDVGAVEAVDAVGAQHAALQARRGDEGGGAAPLLPGRHTAVVQYSGDDVFERGVAVVSFDIADGCGVL